MSVAVESPVAAAYVTALEAIGRPVGLGKKPSGPNLYPYAIVYPGVTDTDGTLLAPSEDGLHRIQVTCVGLTAESALALRDAARNVLRDRSVPIEGHKVVRVEHAGSPPLSRDDDVTPNVFTAVEVANAYITPTEA